MSKPWDDPLATGFGRMVDMAAYQRHCQQVRDLFRQDSGSILGIDSSFVLAIIDFADRHQTTLQRDNLHGGSTEIWSMKIEHDRMVRVICVLVRPTRVPTEYVLEIRTEADWVAGPTGSYITVEERRWFGFTTASPVKVFAQSLELALMDAKDYRVDELQPFPASRARQRAWD
jgi:hypothetical protein